LSRLLFLGGFCKFDGASHDYSEDVFDFLVGGTSLSVQVYYSAHNYKLSVDVVSSAFQENHNVNHTEYRSIIALYK
jgi:hypothetical protein